MAWDDKRPKMPMGAPPIGGIDLPNTGASLHLHGKDLNHLSGAYYKVIGGNEPASLRYLNGYEAAMADYYAQQLGLPRWLKEK